MAIENRQTEYGLIGDVNQIDLATFDMIQSAKDPISSKDLVEKLKIKLTAVNERVTKLVKSSVVKG